MSDTTTTIVVKCSRCNTTATVIFKTSDGIRHPCCDIHAAGLRRRIHTLIDDRPSLTVQEIALAKPIHHLSDV